MLPLAADSGPLTPFSPLHGVVILGMALVILALVLAARRKPDPVRIATGGAALIVWTAYQAWCLTRTSTVDWSDSLPLQVCDMTGWIAPLSLLVRNRWLMATAWFGGLGLSSQTLITPVVSDGPGTLHFWLFWGMHGFIFASAALQVGALGFRPGKGDYGRAWLASLGYVLAVGTLDVATGWNYGYLGNSLPDTPTVLDHLGPWPWRLAVMAAIATGVYFLLWLPFPLAARRKKTQ